MVSHEATDDFKQFEFTTVDLVAGLTWPPWTGATHFLAGLAVEAHFVFWFKRVHVGSPATLAADWLGEQSEPGACKALNRSERAET